MVTKPEFTLFIEEDRREATLFYRVDGEPKRRVDFEWVEGVATAINLGDRGATEALPIKEED